MKSRFGCSLLVLGLAFTLTGCGGQAPTPPAKAGGDATKATSETPPKETPAKAGPKPRGPKKSNVTTPTARPDAETKAPPKAEPKVEETPKKEEAKKEDVSKKVETPVEVAKKPEHETPAPKAEPKTEPATQVAAADTSKPNPALTPAKKYPIDPLDWPHWRGPEQNGISRETGIPSRWTPDGENLLWKRDDIDSHSTPIVLRGKLYILARAEPGTKREGERVVCLDAATGKTVWENRFNVFLSDVPDTRVSWSSVVGDPETGRIYALGVCGLFQCLDGDTGETIWQHSLSEEFGMLTTYGGRTNFPVLFEDLAIISGVLINWGDYAKPNHRFIAFDKATGKCVWMNSTRPLPDDTTYSTPILGYFNGLPALVAGAGDGSLYAIQPRTGKIVWKYDLSLRGLFNTPLIDGKTVYMGHAEENVGDTTMGALLALDGTGAGDVTKSDLALWKDTGMAIGRSAPVLVDGKLFAASDGGKVHIFDVKTGEMQSQKSIGTIVRPSLLWVDGKLFACEMNGRCFIFQPTENGLKAVHQLRLEGPPDEQGKAAGTEIHASPIVSHGRLYITTTDDLYCIGNADNKPAATPRPEAPKEAPLADMTPAQVQVVPAEALIKPGEKVTYEARLYNAAGQYLKSADNAEFTADANGKFEGGVFTGDANANHKAATITAKVGDLVGQARVRMVPPLPWKFDFEDGEVPVTWIGARYRHIIRDVNGNKVMVKITTIPKGTRSQGWMGQPEIANCTIQADVLGKTQDNKVPDIGVQTQRYRLELMGASQELKLYSWISHDQKYKKIPFEWKPDIWYTMKFKASVEERDGKKVAVLQGKVWARGKEEPTAWSIETVDETADHNGSPGLFGNASNAEVFYDNVTVTPN